jgi:predicted nucleic acid-binding protein
MKAIIDSTVILHLAHQREKMLGIIAEYKITEPLITRINYLEVLAGASENAKMSMRKSLREFSVVDFDKKAAEIGNTLAMKYRVSAKNSKDFLIACIAIANKLHLVTENDKDFNYKQLKILPYRISGV